jgi:uncharacterized FAD-dependent dehydrogenase
MHDVVIVGAGPAGMFAAHALAEKKKVLIIEWGKDVSERICTSTQMKQCTKCKPCNIMCGVGGAGTFSDGTLNLRPDIGGDLQQLTGDKDYAWLLVKKVDDVFLKYGTPGVLYEPTRDQFEAWSRKAASAGAKFISIPQRHIGSDHSPELISKFRDDLKSKGVEFLVDTLVDDLIVENGECKGVRTGKGEEIFAKDTLIAPGRVGADWINTLVARHKLKAKFGPIDIGVRVEVPAIVMDPITRVNRDPKFHIFTRMYDDFVRTFCTNAEGFVVEERYDGFVGVNGHSKKDKKSENTNFALLARIHLTEPVENTTVYGRSIAKLATTIGGGRPIVQRMGDLRRGRRTTSSALAKNIVVHTLSDVTPGDISMALPHRIVVDILEALDVLDKIIPGLTSDSTLIYAPEAKFYAMELQVNKRLETNIKHLFAAGDGVGLSRDIVNASATGILAAQGILSE